MTNMTMVVDDIVLKKARKYAVEKNTSVSELVRLFLKRLAFKEDQKKERIISQLERCFQDKSVVLGPKTWTRDDLYER